MGTGEIVLRLVMAVVFGGLIGWEREVHGRAAGLRTHILVAVGAALIMLTSLYIFDMYKGELNIDPFRMAAQVVVGVGFLGAGTIIRSRASVTGLTTAAGIWSVAGIGLAIGIGFYKGAIIATVLVLISLLFLRKLKTG